MKNNDLQFIQDRIGYNFKNLDLLQQAFVRRSYSKENGGENNEVLEFIGDKALDIIIVRSIMKLYYIYIHFLFVIILLVSKHPTKLKTLFMAIPKNLKTNSLWKF